MATLILTAVGSAVGGPLGGALGALVGGTIDRTLLASPGRREGPRLTDLSVQTSSYGSQIAKLFGTVRVAGTVIWSTDLIESRATTRAGKGQPSVTSYSYGASFAVLLSARPIKAVGRIWADGNLLRGAAGDWKAQTGFRLHTGGEDQAPDPLIASAVGIGHAPAHRGCAYAVFEGLQLADFGNRIPSLTFEVVADDGPVGIGMIASALAPGIGGTAALSLTGFAASGGSVGAAIRPLAAAGGAWLTPGGCGPDLRDDPSPDGVVGDEGAAIPGRSAAARTRSIAPIETVPSVLAVSHYDPARDYQGGLQRARRPGPGTIEERLELPAVLGADAAKTIATAALVRAEAARTRRTVAIGLAGLAMAPGRCVSIAGEPGVWRVVEQAVDSYVVTLTLTPTPAAPPAVAGTSGQVAAAPDRVVGATRIELMELPALGDQPLVAPRLTVAATGTGAGWRSAALLVSTDDGASWTPAGTTAAPATMGVLASAPPPAPATILDLANTIEVRLAQPDMTLGDADDDRLDAGANLAVAGDELIQFGRAEPLGNGRWRLSRLLRGRRGTETASGAQAVGDRFVVLERDTALTIDLPLAALGARVRVMASGVGDAVPVEAALVVTGRPLAPPSPVHLAASGSAGGVALHWVRRSRAGWRWIDGVDAPLGEESEAYRVTLTGAGGGVTTFETAEARTGPALDAGTVSAAIVQIGTYGVSPATTLALTEEATP